MANYELGPYEFVDWQGTPPQLVGEQIVSHTRSGVDGTGQQTMGKWSAAFDVVLESWHGGLASGGENYREAKRHVQLYQAMRGDGPVALFINTADGEVVDFEADFQTKFSVDSVEELDCQANVRLVDANNNFPNGAALLCRFRLTPHLIP